VLLRDARLCVHAAESITDMKLPPFEYVSPASLEDAMALLASAPGRAKVIAGGQSLLPVMAFRLAAPELLVDLRRIPALDRIDITATGVRLGAKVRWCDIENDRRLASAHPLLVAATAHVAHYAIRNRGTVGGSLAHADPAAELPGVAAACDAEIVVHGANGTRSVPAASFFLGTLSTVLADDELITELRLPPWRVAGRRWGFEEFAVRRGDFALAGVAAFYDLDPSGRATNAHLGVIGACDRPHRLPLAEAELNGHAPDANAIRAAARAAAGEVHPPSDLHASAAYRRSLVATLIERALFGASER
jgi:carbon-monoxide dehydrogenase medium subunit